MPGSLPDTVTAPSRSCRRAGIGRTLRRAALKTLAMPPGRKNVADTVAIKSGMLARLHERGSGVDLAVCRTCNVHFAAWAQKYNRHSGIPCLNVHYAARAQKRDPHSEAPHLNVCSAAGAQKCGAHDGVPRLKHSLCFVDAQTRRTASGTFTLLLERGNDVKSPTAGWLLSSLPLDKTRR